MISFETFEKYLSENLSLRELIFTHIGDKADYLDQWIANLSILSQHEQCEQLEKVLSELIVANIADNTRMQILYSVHSVVGRLVSQLRSEYIHEPAKLTQRQQNLVKQVQSIYYLCILVYEGVLSRILQDTPRKAKRSWKSMLSLGNASNVLLQEALYFQLQTYLNLIMEDAILFQKPEDLLWEKMNRIYLLAVQNNITTNTVKHKLHAKHADNINEYYLQCCLFSLLRPISYRRQDILSIHKVLPEWAEKTSINIDINSTSKIFVDLQHDQAPEYLTPYSKVNPYDETKLCGFVDLDPLQNYLQALLQSNDEESSSFELRLAKLADYTLSQQQYQPRSETRHPTRHDINVVVGLHRIHYHIADKRLLSTIIREQDLPKAYQTKSHTVPDKKDYERKIPMTILDKSIAGYRFKSNLNKSQSEYNQADEVSEILGGVEFADAQNNALTEKQSANDDVNYNTSLKVLSLIAILPDGDDPNSRWELGIVRWIDHEDNGVQAGARLIGYSVTACGIRLETKDNRSQDFVPALLVSGNESLETKTTLIIPQYHFKTGDRVILRIGTKQTNLKLAANLMSTNDMQQYEIVRMAG